MYHFSSDHRRESPPYGSSRRTLDHTRTQWQRRQPLACKAVFAIVCAIALATCIGLAVVVATTSDDVNKPVMVALLACSAIAICACPLIVCWMMSSALPTSTKTIDALGDDLL